jgi:hypothetical protein
MIDSGFFRRLKFYIFGFLIGALAVNILFKGKACRMPATIKLEELNAQRIEYSERALCKMKCVNMNDNEIKELLKKGSINYNESDTHASPCPTYSIEEVNSNKQKIRIVIADCDTISKIMNITNLTTGKDSCQCN